MSRRREPPRTPAPRKAAAKPTGRVWMIALAVFVIAALAWWGRSMLPGTRMSDTRTTRVLPLDSVSTVAREYEAATVRRDWAQALALQTRIVEALPTHPLALRQLAQTLHNHQVAVQLPDGQTGWLLRTSLDRAAFESRALALLDSSGRVSQTASDLALSHYWKGALAAYYGLPVDALTEFEAARALAPQDTSIARLCRQLRRQMQSDRN